MSKGSTKVFGGLISDLEASKAALFQFLATAVLLAFAMNLLANWFNSRFSQAALGWTGLSILFVVAVYWALRWFRARTREFSYSGYLLVDEGKRTLLPVQGYGLCEDAHRYSTAAFAENPALKSQWDQGSFGLNALSLRATEKDNPTEQLIRELLEYVILERLSCHLTDFFDHNEVDERMTRKYERTDIPDLLLRNRFLELFSRPMKDRAPFADEKDTEPVPIPGYLPEEVAFQTGDKGAIYSRFNLVLPSDSTVRAIPDGGFEIDSPIVSLTIRPTFWGFNENVPTDFLSMYMGVAPFRFVESRRHQPAVAAYSVLFDIEFSSKLRGVFSRRASRYYSWIDSFCHELNSYASSEAFFASIQWPVIEAVLRCLDNRDREKADARGEGRTARSAERARFRITKHVRPD
jgi:hypothetical protein